MSLNLEEISETCKLIDVRIKFNNELDPTPHQMAKFSDYFAARTIHSYVNHVRPFKWPGTEEMTDCQIFHKIMNDLEVYSFSFYEISDWIKKLKNLIIRIS